MAQGLARLIDTADRQIGGITKHLDLTVHGFGNRLQPGLGLINRHGDLCRGLAQGIGYGLLIRRALDEQCNQPEHDNRCQQRADLVGHIEQRLPGCTETFLHQEIANTTNPADGHQHRQPANQTRQQRALYLDNRWCRRRQIGCTAAHTWVV